MGKKTWRYKIRPIRVDGAVAYISLTQGKVAIIDSADVSLVEGWNWCAVRTPGGLWYAYNAGNRKLRLHQFLLPPPPGMVTDHRDRDGLNCRRANLRFATMLDNSRNRKVAGKSGFKGVAVRPLGRWRARITVKGQRIFLGDWPTAEAAARVYDMAAQKYFGEFAFLNFPDKRESWDDMWQRPFDYGALK